jgi:hypothetical protein
MDWHFCFCPLNKIRDDEFRIRKIFVLHAGIDRAAGLGCVALRCGAMILVGATKNQCAHGV